MKLKVGNSPLRSIIVVAAIITITFLILKFGKPENFPYKTVECESYIKKRSQNRNTITVKATIELCQNAIAMQNVQRTMEHDLKKLQSQWFWPWILLVGFIGGLLPSAIVWTIFREKLRGIENRLNQEAEVAAKQIIRDEPKKPLDLNTVSVEEDVSEDTQFKLDMERDVLNEKTVEIKEAMGVASVSNTTLSGLYSGEASFKSGNNAEQSSAPDFSDWHWLNKIFGSDGLMVKGDEFDNILYKYTQNIHNIDFYNASFTLISYQDASVPTDARLLLLEIGTGVPALVIPSYGFANRFSNATPVVANYASSELSTFFEMVPDGPSELKLAQPALISRSGNEWNIDTIQKGELRGFQR